MDERTTKELIGNCDSLSRRSVRYRRGEVTTAAPLAVDLGDSGTPTDNCKRLSSYTPTVGDQVAVLVFGNDLLVLGEIA